MKYTINEVQGLNEEKTQSCVYFIKPQTVICNKIAPNALGLGTTVMSKFKMVEPNLVDIFNYIKTAYTIYTLFIKFVWFWSSESKYNE